MLSFHPVFVCILPSALLLSRLPWASAAQYDSAKPGSQHHQLTFASGVDQKQQFLRPNTHHTLSGDDFAAEVILFDPLDDLRKALIVLQNEWFEPWIGTWPRGIDWTRAVIDTHLVSAAGSFSKALLRFDSNQDGSRSDARDLDNELNGYFTQNVAYYFGEDAFAIRNQANDDMLWVVLGWLGSITSIKDHSDRHYRFNPTEPIPGQGLPWHGEQFISAFAHRARIFWEIAEHGWDDKLCNGGMIWNPRLGPYKNAITNELFITGSVGMYLQFPGDNNTSPHTLEDKAQGGYAPIGRFDSKFLKAAVKGYDWLKNVGMTNDQGLYVDGFHISHWKKNGTKCDIRNEMVYSYNQGVILSGLRGLWESTGNISYLEDAHELARNVVKATGWDLNDRKELDSDRWQGLGRNGILEDRCDARGRCSQDGQTFKGIFWHHLALLCQNLPLTARVPGKTFGAGRDLLFLHAQSCKLYTPWVEHNAKAALGTRDSKGRIGVWWGAEDTDDAQPLPEGAMDYRNNASELLSEPWTDENGLPLTDSQDAEDTVDLFSSKQRVLALSPDIPSSDSTLYENTVNRDLNDRGRGRTVETHSGGVAVLRALWELQDLES